MGCSFCANRIRKRSNVQVGNRVIPLRSTRFCSYMHFLLHPSFYRFFPLFYCFFFPFLSFFSISLPTISRSILLFERRTCERKGKKASERERTSEHWSLRGARSAFILRDPSTRLPSDMPTYIHWCFAFVFHRWKKRDGPNDLPRYLIERRRRIFLYVGSRAWFDELLLGNTRRRVIKI